jgi:hypothetical protein
MGGGVQIDKVYRMTTVDLNNIGYRDEPFVLAINVALVFYVNDMSIKLRKRKKRISRCYLLYHILSSYTLIPFVLVPHFMASTSGHSQLLFHPLERIQIQSRRMRFGIGYPNTLWLF